MPAGYGVRDEPTPIAATFGLSQRERLQSASETAYETALERMFRSRLIYRLEEQLEANINNPGFVYEALKVYLMVGGQCQRTATSSSPGCAATGPRTSFRAPATPSGREALEEHLPGDVRPRRRARAGRSRSTRR